MADTKYAIDISKRNAKCKVNIRICTPGGTVGVNRAPCMVKGVKAEISVIKHLLSNKNVTAPILILGTN